MEKRKAYIIRNREEFFVVNKLLSDYYEYSDFPDSVFKEIIIVYSKSRLYNNTTPGWDYYTTVCDDATILNKYDIVEASTILRKQKLIKLGSF